MGVPGDVIFVDDTPSHDDNAVAWHPLPLPEIEHFPWYYLFTPDFLHASLGLDVPHNDTDLGSHIRVLLELLLGLL